MSRPTRTKYGISPWIDAFPKTRRPAFPRYRATASHPVVIVGGGLTGCMTAYAFAAAGIKVVVLEADRLGVAAAARGPGVLQGEATASYRDTDAQYGRRFARAVFDASRHAVLDLATTTRRLGIKPGVETVDALRVLTTHGSDEKKLLKETALRRDAGLDAIWLKATAATRESHTEAARAAVRLHDWGQVDPYRLLVGFANAARKRGATFFEHSTVRRVKAGGKHVEIQLERATLTTDTVIVCTGEPTALFRPLERHVRSAERYLALTDPLPASVRQHVQARARIVTDTDSPAHIVRWTADGRMLIAGADQERTTARARDKVVVQRTGQLMYELSRMYPAISGVMPAYGWDLPIAASSDDLLYAGPHRNYPRHLFAWATRHDPAQAFLASRILLRHYLGHPTRADAYFAFTRG